MRLILFSLTGCLLGCGGADTAPPPFTPQHREMVKESLSKLGAKVTAEVPETLYLSLRNNHFEIRELGAIIESAPRTQRDIQDFALANRAIASCFLEPGEVNAFGEWLRMALSRQAQPVLSAEHKQFTITLSRKPLRAIYTRARPAEAE